MRAILVPFLASSLLGYLAQPIVPARRLVASQDSEALQAEVANSFASLEGGQKLEDIADNASTSDRNEIVVSREATHYHTETLIPGDPNILITRYKRAFIVVEGLVEGCDSGLTRDHSFIISDCLIRVQTMIKSSPLVDIRIGSTIVVARSGGELLVHGKQITASDKGFPPFTMGGRYIFYLPEPTPTFGAFVAAPVSTFRVIDGKVIPQRTDDKWGSFSETEYREINSVARQAVGGEN